MEKKSKFDQTQKITRRLVPGYSISGFSAMCNKVFVVVILVMISINIGVLDGRGTRFRYRQSKLDAEWTKNSYNQLSSSSADRKQKCKFKTPLNLREALNRRLLCCF